MALPGHAWAGGGTVSIVVPGLAGMSNDGEGNYDPTEEFPDGFSLTFGGTSDDPSFSFSIPDYGTPPYSGTSVMQINDYYTEGGLDNIDYLGGEDYDTLISDYDANSFQLFVNLEYYSDDSDDVAYSTIEFDFIYTPSATATEFDFSAWDGVYADGSWSGSGYVSAGAYTVGVPNESPVYFGVQPEGDFMIEALLDTDSWYIDDTDGTWYYDLGDLPQVANAVMTSDYDYFGSDPGYDPGNDLSPGLYYDALIDGEWEYVTYADTLDGDWSDVTEWLGPYVKDDNGLLWVYGGTTDEDPRQQWYAFLEATTAATGENSALTDGYSNNVANFYTTTPPPMPYVDYNRDGIISLGDGTDYTAPDYPFVFWLNNNNDGPGVFPAYSTVQGDLNPASGNMDWTSDAIVYSRDLEDFARLWINIPGNQSDYNSGNYEIGLKWIPLSGESFSGYGGSNYPTLKLFTSADALGGAGYLTSNSTAADQMTYPYNTAIIGLSGNGSYTTQIQPTGDADYFYDFLIPSSAFGNLTTGNPAMHFLFEACTPGRGQLQVILLKKYTSGDTSYYAEYGSTHTGGSVFFDFQDIKQLYERWTVGEGNGLDPTDWPGSNDTGDDAGTLSYATLSTQRMPFDDEIPGNYTLNPGLSLPGNDAYILIVHGNDDQGWQKDALAETALKRLYWQGYTGKFGAFQWPTTYYSSSFPGELEAPFAYADGDFAAWYSASYLLELLHNEAKLGQYGDDNLYLLAHSQGNTVVGEALHQAAELGYGQVVNTYLATQAAVAGSMWDASLDSSAPLHFTFGPYTPDIFANWFQTNTYGSLAMGSAANFYNANDYALGWWRVSQAFTKPAIRAPLLGDLVYYYSSYTLSSVSDDFQTVPYSSLADSLATIATHTDVDPTTWGDIAYQHLASGDTINQQYEILSYAAQPRSLPLGNITTGVSGFSGTNLGANPSASPYTSLIWGPDALNTSGTMSTLYSEAPWHSAEFNFDTASQWTYWHTVLGQHGFDLLP